jgi:ELWxxDGT repeat protein
LWSTDGTPAGTRLVKDIGPGTTGGVFAAAAVGRDGYHSPGAVTVGNRVYFAANDGTRGYELWKTDGTTAGTVLVKDLFPGANSGLRFSGEMEAVNDRLYLFQRHARCQRDQWPVDQRRHDGGDHADRRPGGRADQGARTGRGERRAVVQFHPGG